MKKEKLSLFDERTVINNGEIYHNYNVTPYGAAINKNTRKIIKPREKTNQHDKSLPGYKIVDIYDDNGNKHTLLQHRLVAQAYIPNPENLPTVNHKNGDKQFNAYYNLEWMSYKDNNIHALETGLATRAKCEKHQNATLTNNDVENICRLLEKGYLYKDIAKELNLEHIKNIISKIKMINTGNSWTEISKKYTFKPGKNKERVYSDELVISICEYLEKYGFISNDDIIQNLKLPNNQKIRKLIYSIRTRKKYKYITEKYNF